MPRILFDRKNESDDSVRMCYSAMVEQNAKKYGVRFKARIQTDLYDDLFRRRLLGEKLYLNKAMEAQFLAAPKTPEEQQIRDCILQWHEEQIPLLEAELFKQTKRLADAIRSLETKSTRKAENDQRIATNKIRKLKSDIEKHQRREVVSDSDARIFPLHYMSMLCLDDAGQKVVRPVRYLMRPHNKDERFDSQFNGCYNARFDNLESVPWWRDCLGRRHGLIMVQKFYENVGAEDYLKNNSLPPGAKDRETLVLCFQPDNVETMFIPTLWDQWEKKGSSSLFSAALITDEPAPEIARAGHDRTPIFLKESAVDDWLFARETNPAALKELLNQREFPSYSHRVLGAA